VEGLRSTLIVAEIALALVLLTGAGLMLKSFMRLRAVDPGFRPDHVITLTVDLPSTAYPTAEKLRTFHPEMLSRLSTLPGVIKPDDPATFAAVALVIAAIALIASLVPARRATRVDPLLALRHE
jgi:ABC-type lipoprotein release transport system permease subunit